MRTRIIILAALGVAFTVATATPAMADRDGWRRHEWRDRGGYGHHGGFRHHPSPHGGYGRPYYAGPPVVYVPPRVVPYYYAPPPPPVYYGVPSVNFGFSFR